MEREYFVNKSECEFAITSGVVSPDEITQEIEIEPSRSFKKGHTYISKPSGSVITNPHNLWAINSKAVISEEETLQPHIDYLKTKLSGKLAILKRYKKDKNLELIIGISIETDGAGIWLDLNEEDLDFINKICNRLSCSLLVKGIIE